MRWLRGNGRAGGAERRVSGPSDGLGRGESGMKHRCRDCHFLVHGDPHYYTNGDKESWDKGEREAGKIVSRVDTVPFCCRGVWHTRPGPGMSSEQRETKLREIIDKNRKDDCFFIEYYEGMTFPTAEELHRTRNENRQLKRSYQYTLWGLNYCGYRPCGWCLFSGCEFLCQMKG